MPTPAQIERWRKRAEEMRTLADQLREPQLKRMMIDLARTYEALVGRAEKASAHK